MDISLRYYRKPDDTRGRTRKVGIRNVRSYRFDGDKLIVEFADKCDENLIHVGYYEIKELNTIKHRGT
jgi:hypothetical protein